MNQYDFEPPPPSHIRALKIVALSIFAFMALLLVVLFSGCAEKEPLPTLDDKLQGAWQREWYSLTNRYNFHGGACDTYAIIPAQPIQYYAYSYTTKGDTLTMLDLGVGQEFVFVVEFPTDSTAVLIREGGINYFLKRL
jgi:hypothetical protein